MDGVISFMGFLLGALYHIFCVVGDIWYLSGHGHTENGFTALRIQTCSSIRIILLKGRNKLLSYSPCP